jgi:hypothetical protein
MSYIGNTPTTQNFISGTDYFNGTGAQTAFTLSRTVNSVNDIQVTVNNVVQQPNDAYTLSGTTLTMTSAPSAGTNNVYVRYLSTTTQVITPSQNTVSWNTLDSNTQQDLGLMYKNKIINGNMVIDQRNAGASVSTSSGSGVYTVDRWIAQYSATSKFTIQQSSTAPTGFTKSALITSSAATSVGSGDYYLFAQRLEGFNTADLGFGTANAKTITISFWVRSSLTGTFGGSLTNDAQDRSYPFTYTISSANTFEYKSVTIPGDTTGTWATDNNCSFKLWFGLGVGSSLSGTANAWAGTQYLSATGATSVVATNGATWYLTGVQLEAGTQATAFSTAGGSYGAELALCQRYYEQIGGTGDGNSRYPAISAYQSGTYDFATSIQFAVQKRAIPTMTTVGTFSYSNASGATADGPTKDGFRFYATATSTGYVRVFSNATTAYVTASAEL